MDVKVPGSVLTSRVDAAVLQVLGRTSGPLTGREVARLAVAGSQPAVQASLTRLARYGLVTARPAGRAVLYSLNREHLAMPAVEALTGIRAELFERIRHSVESWSSRPVHLSLFGSMARSDGDSGSDIDLFVVRPRTVDGDNAAWRSNLEQLQHNIETWTGNHAAPVDVSLDDVAIMRKKRDRLLTELQRDGVLLVGKPIENIAVPTKRAS